jgi:hypothetical protein
MPIEEQQFHQHTGLDSPKINPKDLEGFTILTAAPTYTAQNGTIVFSDTGAVRKMHIMMNGIWRYITLT